MKIRTQGNQAFNVPNTEEGQLFLRLLRKFRNRRWFYRARGRGSRKEHGDASYIPKAFSEWFAVYLTHPMPPANWHQQWQPVPVAAPPPLAVISSDVIEWSAPIGPGDKVGMSHTGKVFNADVHGVNVGPYIGVAVGPSVGSIGDSEAKVPVRLDFENLGVDVSLSPVENVVPTQEPEKDHATEDVAELDVEELGLLEEILSKIHNEYQAQAWEEEKQEVFDSLYKKLVS